MNLQHNLGLFCVSFLTFASLNVAKLTAQSSWDRVSPYVEESTAAVAAIDLKQADPGAVIDQIQKILAADLTEQQIALTKGMLVSTVQSLRNAGVDQVYATVSSIDVPRGGVTIWLPCKEPKPVADFARAAVAGIAKSLKYEVVELSDLVVVCDTLAWQRLSQKPNMARPVFQQAFGHAETKLFQLVVELPKSLQQDLHEVWPDRLPANSPVNLSPKQFVKDIASVDFVVRGPVANAEVLMSITCQDEAATSQVRELMQSLIKMVEPISKISIQSKGDQITLQLTADELRTSITKLIAPARDSAKRTQKTNDLKQVGLAMHMFTEKNGYLPPREVRGADNKPLLSWRVLLLPYLGQETLYKSFHLNEPWDSEHNRKLIENMPQVYGDPLVKLAPGMTTTQVPLVKGSAWSGDGEPLTLESITDGTSNTIAFLVVPADHATIWTKPDEWEFPLADAASVLLKGREFVITTFFDGSVRTLTKADQAEIPKYLTATGGEL